MHLPSLPPDAVLLDVFKAFPESSKALLDYHEVLPRGSSPFSAAERELIAAYVSGLNNCGYCHGVHTATAEAFGIPHRLLADVVTDLDTAAVDARMPPVLRYVRKLIRTPSRMTRSDADDFFAAGWDEQAFHDVMSVCALFNFMNRLVEGFGVHASDAYSAVPAGRLSNDAGHACGQH